MTVLVAASGNDYVAAAYLVFLFLVLSYLAIMAVKLSRIEREVVEITEIAARRNEASDGGGAGAPPARTKESVT